MTLHMKILLLAARGQVAYGAPSCGEYSRLKLRYDSGPKALWTPEQLQGRRGLTVKPAKSKTVLDVNPMCYMFAFNFPIGGALSP